MSDYVIEDGGFYRACKQLLLTENYQFSWVDRKALPKLFEPRVFEAGEDVAIPEPDDRNRQGTVIIGSSDESTDARDSLTIPWLSNGMELTFGELVPDGFITQEHPKKQTRYRYMCPSCNVKLRQTSFKVIVYGLQQSLRVGQWLNHCVECVPSSFESTEEASDQLIVSLHQPFLYCEHSSNSKGWIDSGIPYHKLTLCQYLKLFMR